MDTIHIHGLEASCIIGILDWERETRQTLIFDIDLTHDTSRCIEDDTIDYALDYSTISSSIISYVENSDFNLIETLCENVAKEILSKFGVESVHIKLDKGSVVDDVFSVGVSMTRDKSWFLSLEANFSI